MAQSFEKSVKGATKVKLAPPKSKYIEHILIATHGGEAGVNEVFRVLQNRLRDSTWTVVFKSLIVVHLLIREGRQDAALKHLSNNPQRTLAINNFTEGNFVDRALTAHGKPAQTQGRNIRAYTEYLVQRAKSYGRTKVDYVRDGDGRLKRLTVDKGLLRETEEVQEQVWALLRCDFLSHDAENEITITAFRLLTMDLIALYFVMNEGTMSVLEHFLEMSKPDAERALNIYKRFVKQTEHAISFLSVARHFEHATRVEVPKMKHAPTNLIKNLEEHLNDPEFEQTRRRFVADKEAKKTGKKINGASSKPPSDAKPPTVQTNNASFPDPKPATSQASPSKAPAGDLIDFFGSIEQTPMAQPQYQTPAGVPPAATGFVVPQYNFPMQNTGTQQPFGAPNTQSTNPFAQTPQPQQQQVQTNFTGSGFGGYTPQPQQQQTGFTPSLSSIPQSSVATFQQQQQPQPSFTGGSIVASPTAGTNPFRQSMMPTGSTTSSFSTVSSTPTGATTSTMSTPVSQIARQSTNPFAKTATPPQPTQPFTSPPSQPFTSPPPQPFASQPPQQPQPTSSPFSPSPFAQPQAQLQTQTQQQPLMPAPTGTNPFAKAPPVSSSPFSAQQQPPLSGSPFSTQAPTATALLANPTGSTNPFRQSAFVNQATGQGWQNSGTQGTIGGLPSDTLTTVPVFPRPGQPPGGGQQQMGWQG